MPRVSFHHVMTEARGQQPKDSVGRRVHVITRGGYDTRHKEADRGTAAPGWAADSTNWEWTSARPSARADVVRYMILR